MARRKRIGKIRLTRADRVHFATNTRMPKKDEFVLKDSPPELIKASGVEPKGRSYDAAYERKP